MFKIYKSLIKKLNINIFEFPNFKYINISLVIILIRILQLKFEIYIDFFIAEQES